MPDHVWRSLLAHGSLRRYDTREVLVRQGEAGTYVVAIEEGRVKMTRSEVNGIEVVLAVRGAGELVGAMSVIDGRASPVTVTALRPCVASLLPDKTFISLLSGSELALSMLRYALARQRESDQIRAEVSVLPLSVRLVRMLLRLSETTSMTASGDSRLDLYIPQEELARAVGASRSQVCAALARLRSHGILSTGRRHVVVHDHASLRAVGAGRLAI